MEQLQMMEMDTGYLLGINSGLLICFGCYIEQASNSKQITFPITYTLTPSVCVSFGATAEGTAEGAEGAEGSTEAVAAASAAAAGDIGWVGYGW